MIEALERHVTSHVRAADGDWQRPIIVAAGALEFTPIGVIMTRDAIDEDTSLA